MREPTPPRQTYSHRVVGLVAGMIPLVLPAVAAAQDDVARAAQETTIPGGQLALVAYIVLWLLLMGYIAKLALQQRALEGEIEELEQRIEDSLD